MKYPILTNYSQLDKDRYDDSLIRSYKRTESYIVGDRRVGKTFKWLMKMIKNSLEKRALTFLWLRISKTEIDDASLKFFDDISNFNIFPEYIFYIVGKIGYAKEKTTGKSFQICYLDFVKNAQNLKGVPFPDAEYVVLDEFMQEEGTIKCKNVVSLFWSIAYSVFALRKVRCVFIGNAVTITNPFFVYRGVKNIDRPFTKGKLYVVENTNEEDRYDNFRKRAKKSSFGQMVKGSEYEKYALDNKFILDDLTNIDSKVKPKSNGIISFQLEDTIVTIFDEGSFFLFKNCKGNNCLICTPFANKSNNDIIYLKYSDNVLKKIFKLCLTKQRLYSSLNVKNKILELSNKCLGSLD